MSAIAAAGLIPLKAAPVRRTVRTTSSKVITDGDANAGGLRVERADMLLFFFPPSVIACV